MIRDMRQGERGQVRIGSSFPITPPSPVYYYQYEFSLGHPNVALSLHVHPAAQIEALLDNRELDFGISQVPASRLGIASEPMYTDRLGVIVGAGHPLARTESVYLRELHREVFLCNSSAPDPNDSARHICALAGFVPNIMYEGESADLIGEFVAMGRGISFVSQRRYEAFRKRSAMPEWERTLHYVALRDEFCIRTIYLHYRSTGYLSQAASLFHQGLSHYLIP